MNAAAHWIFVYGTLKRGDCRAWALRGQRFVGEARSRPEYRMYNVGTFPGLVRSSGGLSIQGELWQVDAACLKILDEVEGLAQGLYTREPITLQPPHDGLDVEAYFYARSTHGMRDCGAVW